MRPATPTLPTKLAYRIDHRLNILFRGRHGVGKTTIGENKGAGLFLF